MSRRNLSVFLGLLLAVAALFCAVEQGWAQPVLNPNVDLSKPNFAYSPPLRKFIDSLPGLGSGARATGSALGANNRGQYIPIASPTAPPPGVPNDGDYYEIALVEYHEQLHGDLSTVVGIWPAAQTGGTKLRGYVQENGGVAIDTPHYLGPLIIAKKDRPVRIKFTNRLPVTASGGNLFLPVDTTIMGAGLGPLGAGGGNYPQNRAAVHLHGGLPPWISDGTPHQWVTPNLEPGPYNKGVGVNNVPDMPVPPNGSMTFYWTNQQPGRLMFYHDHAYGITRLNVYGGEAAGYLLVDPAEDDALKAAGVPGTYGSIPANQDLPHLIPLVIQDKTFVYDAGVTPVGVSRDPTRFTSATDPLWTSSVTTWGGATPPAGGNFWFPHVYVPNQDPTALSGANPLGRWDYGPWFWPVFPVVSPYPPAVSTVPEAFMDTPVVNGAAYPYLEVAPVKYRLRILNACNDRMLNLQLYQADAQPTAFATVTATVAVAGGPVTSLNFTPATDGGSGYVAGSSPMVHIVGGGGYGAWATATVDGTGKVASVTLTNGGGGYSTAPTVTIGGSTEVKMVPAVPNAAIPFPPLWLSQTPGMTPDILDSRLSGVPDPSFRGPAMVQIGTEGGLLPAPVVLPNTPVGFEQNKRNIVVLNVLEKTLFMGPAERADVIVDFSGYAGRTIILYNDAPAPVPASDPRNDFYTGNPDYSETGVTNYQGGAAPTMPGYGPNTRTVMQFRVTANGDPYNGAPAAPDQVPTSLVTALDSALPAVFASNTLDNKPIVPQPDYPPASGAYSATATYSRISDTNLTFTPPGSASPVTIMMQPKAIQELFDPEGRMNSTLGVEMRFTGALIQTTVPLGYTDPPTEKIVAGQTQLWKITHNGVDTHAVHFHLVNVQVINRVGWDGAIRPPDPNELGWKETVRMNPLEDIIVAMRAKVPTYPFTVPNSIRLHNVTMPEGATFASLDPTTGAPITVTNAMTDFGHEYVWHCHILGHEENDMMRPFILDNNLLYMDFSGNGAWKWSGGALTQLTPLVPTDMVASGGILYGNFTGYGLYKWNGSAWSNLTPLVSTSMVASGSALYAGFAGYGLYEWNGSAWSNLTPLVPTSMVASGGILYGNFTGYGLYKWNGSAWSNLTPLVSTSMVASGSNLYANFAGYGLYQWDGTAWSQLNTIMPTSMVASGSNLYANFAGYGLYQWDGTAWSQLNTVVSTSMVVAGANLYADFAGYGLYKWDGIAWTQIKSMSPTSMAASGSLLYANFGAGNGLWMWDDFTITWNQITPNVPTLIVAGN